MLFDFNFHSSLLLVFFVHNMVYTGLFLYRGIVDGQRPAMWLGVFSLLSASYITPWMVGFAGWYGTQPYRDVLFYVPFQQLFLFGPVVFFYVVSLFNPRFNLSRRHFPHFLPAILYNLFCIVMVVYDKVIVGRYFFLANGQDPDFDEWYQIAGYASMMMYVIAAIRYYYRYKRVVEQVLSNAGDFLFRWVRNFLVAFLLTLAAWLYVALFGLFYQVDYNDSWWYFLSFALICYYIGIAGYNNAVVTPFFFRTRVFGNEAVTYQLQAQRLRLDAQTGSFEEVILEDADQVEEPTLSPEMQRLGEEIRKLLSENRLFEQPDLSLFDLAQHLDTNITVLSRVINRVFQQNFNDLVNQYRIEDFMQRIKNLEHKRHTLLSLAYDCGFNSKTTFNRAFRKATGQTPQEFIRAQKP